MFGKQPQARLLPVSWVTLPPLPPHEGQGKGATRREEERVSPRMAEKILQENGRRMEGKGGGVKR